MQLVGKFTFLKMEKSHTKPNNNGEVKDFLLVSLLDDQQNLCRFFIFNQGFMQKLQLSNFKLYQELVGSLDVTFYKDNWNVSLKELYERREPNK